MNAELKTQNDEVRKEPTTSAVLVEDARLARQAGLPVLVRPNNAHEKEV